MEDNFFLFFLKVGGAEVRYLGEQFKKLKACLCVHAFSLKLWTSLNVAISAEATFEDTVQMINNLSVPFWVL